MKMIEIKAAAQLNLPDDFVVLNPEDAARSPYAVAVEVREPLDGGKRFRCPHFIHLSEKKYSDLTHADILHIVTACAESDPAFQKALDALTEPVYRDGRIVNWDEVAAAPHIGIFNIPDASEVMEGHAAYGCMINR